MILFLSAAHLHLSKSKSRIKKLSRYVHFTRTRFCFPNFIFDFCKRDQNARKSFDCQSKTQHKVFSTFSDVLFLLFFSLLLFNFSLLLKRYRAFCSTEKSFQSSSGTSCARQESAPMRPTLDNWHSPKMAALPHWSIENLFV